ncbi:MAG: Rpn family recombination-promoting nuclease/putative transposase, partial [Bacilli bacterium]|nr:Rpn family recombination-promoting nuclease/putative transposase [Bacilli bacterium]
MKEKTKIKFIPLTNDILFKDTYSRKENRKYLEDLLECYYGYPRGFLKDKLKVSHEVTLDKYKYHDKNIRSDLVIIVDDKIKLDIEMYSSFNDESKKKSKYYAMRIYSTQLKAGDAYNQIGKVTQINFVDNVKLEISEEIKSTVYIDDDFEQDYVRLDVARKIDYTNSRFIKYLRFLGSRSREERSKYALGDEIMTSLDKWLEWYTNTDSL